MVVKCRSYWKACCYWGRTLNRRREKRNWQIIVILQCLSEGITQTYDKCFLFPQGKMSPSDNDITWVREIGWSWLIPLILVWQFWPRKYSISFNSIKHQKIRYQIVEQKIRSNFRVVQATVASTWPQILISLSLT